MRAFRAVRLAFVAVAALLGGPALASGPALVVEADSGRVLHAERATDPWFPASITKLMTAYVALDRIRTNQASAETLLTVSDSAAAQPPSKMGFKPGTQVRLDNALKILMVKSANDVAATIAENLGGSIEGFSEIMNQTAVRLGMADSHFANPHGLPDERNQTTARDMAILARALIKEFPDHHDLFQIGAIQYGRRIMRNTNGLIGRYPGADGMKTGFICSAGFNVVASATRNGRHLITVVMGAPSANERTMKAAELFDRGFNSQATWGNPTLAALPASASTSAPDMRSVICDRRGPMPKEEDSPTTIASEEPNGVPNLFSAGMMAFAAGGQPMRTSLGPRSAVQPELVWVGLNPPSQSEIAAEAKKEEEAAAQAREAKSQKAKAAQEKAAKDKASKATASKRKDSNDKGSNDKVSNDKGTTDKDEAGEVASDDAKPVARPTTASKGRTTISVKPVTEKAKAPVTKDPATKTPVAKTPVAKTPVAKTSNAETPDAKAPGGKTVAPKQPTKAAPKPAAASDAAPQKTASPAKPKAAVN